MKVLFFLPAITDWWFEKIIMPMLRTLAADREVAQIHLMVAQPWRSSGLGAHQILWLSGLGKIQCHIVDSASGPDVAWNFRFNSAAVPSLLNQVKAIDADLTLARTADPAICREFPGRVRFVTEGAVPPYPTDGRWVVLEEEAFGRGFLPAAAASFAQSCAEVVRDLPLPDLSVRHARAALGLDMERPVIAVPLQFEHPDNFFRQLAAFPTSQGLIDAMLDQTDPEVLLAFTDHPLNIYHDRSKIKAMLNATPDRTLLCEQQGATALMVAGADAMVSDMSKSWSLAAHYDTPIVDVGRQPAAEWINALPGLASLPRLPRRADLPVADRQAMELWYGWHLGARILDPRLATLSALLRRFDDQPDPDDFRRNRAALERQVLVAS
jgi:hypothetical protein